MAKKNGRPTIMTPQTIAKLEEAFSIGATDKEACIVADIGMSTLYDYCVANPSFSEKKESLKDMPKYKARKNVVNAIREGNASVSQWYLERKAKNEFAQRTEMTGDNGEKLFDNMKEKTDDELIKLSRASQ